MALLTDRGVELCEFTLEGIPEPGITLLPLVVSAMSTTFRLSTTYSGVKSSGGVDDVADGGDIVLVCGARTCGESYGMAGGHPTGTDVRMCVVTHVVLCVGAYLTCGGQPTGVGESEGVGEGVGGGAGVGEGVGEGEGSGVGEGVGERVGDGVGEGGGEGAEGASMGEPQPTQLELRWKRPKDGTHRDKCVLYGSLVRRALGPHGHHLQSLTLKVSPTPHILEQVMRVLP